MDSPQVNPPDQICLRAPKPGRLPARGLKPGDPMPMAYAGPGDDERPLPAAISATDGYALPEGTQTDA